MPVSGNSLFAPETVPVIQVTGFAPYPGISSLPGGPLLPDRQPLWNEGRGHGDGGDLDEVTAANLPNLVQTDRHVAQHNIFADATPPGSQIKAGPRHNGLTRLNS